MRHRRDSGYSLLMVVFMVATILIFAAAAAPNLLTQGRREREAETVWRGQQYERAIGLYYRKFGKYPSKVDDLTKQTNGVRFLREAYTDPMNKEDGSWRFIYVGPNGQLIGSLKQTNLLQGVLSSAALPGAGLVGAGAQPPPPANPTAGGAANAPGQTGTQTAGGLAPNPLQSQPQPLTGAVIGGNIIGVGSKIKEPSLRVYDGGDTYEKWEFIWNPLQQGAMTAQAPVNPAAPAQQTSPTQPTQQAPQNPGLGNGPGNTPQMPQ